MAFVHKKELSVLCAAITISITSVVSAMVWVDKRIEMHSGSTHKGVVTESSFIQYLDGQRIYNQQVIDRLQSMEEAIRSIVR